MEYDALKEKYKNFCDQYLEEKVKNVIILKTYITENQYEDDTVKEYLTKFIEKYTELYVLFYNSIIEIDLNDDDNKHQINKFITQVNPIISDGFDIIYNLFAYVRKIYKETISDKLKFCRDENVLYHFFEMIADFLMVMYVVENVKDERTILFNSSFTYLNSDLFDLLNDVGSSLNQYANWTYMYKLFKNEIKKRYIGSFENFEKKYVDNNVIFKKFQHYIIRKQQIITDEIIKYIRKNKKFNYSNDILKPELDSDSK